MHSKKTKLKYDYAEFTDWPKRLDNELPLLRELLKPEQNPALLDIGCGEGVHAVALARDGAQVTGIDRDGAALRKARMRAFREGAKCSFKKMSVREMKNIRTYYNGVMCIGNVLALMESWADVAETLGHIKRILHPNGTAVIQALNYPPHFAGRSYYDFKTKRKAINGKQVRAFKRFQTLTDEVELQLAFTDKPNQIPEYSIAAKMLPLTWDKLSEIVIPLGLKFTLYSDYRKTPFLAKDSKDMIIVLRHLK